MFVPLKVPPGVVKPGTVYDAKGRWYVADFVRWHDGVMQPMGGWEALTGATGSDVTGAIRGLLTWKRNNGDAKLMIGTESKLYVYADGTLTDETPGGFTTGGADASGDYWSRTEANSWQMDNYGEDVLCCAYSDGVIYLYDSSAGSAAALTNAPTSCKGVVVTPERFVFALGASGDDRAISWADQDDSTDWTASDVNQAGSFNLPSQGAIMAGRRGKGETLIWTDVDLFAARYIAGELIYSFKKVGSNCGAISRRSMVVIDGWAIWMGQNNFYVYDGAVRTVPCEVSDWVFADLNRAQASKIAVHPLTDWNEVRWYYPSSGATENDRMVWWNYVEGHWGVVDSFERTDGIDRGFLEYPIAGDAAGCIYWHEKGAAYADDGNTPSYVPKAESGPVELNADQVMHVVSVIPDEATLGDVDFHLLHSFYPTDAETDTGPLTVSQPTDVRVTARQVRLKLTQNQSGWRFGTPRLDLRSGGRR